MPTTLCVTLTHTAAGGEYEGSTVGIAVTVVDDDRGIIISPASLKVDEGDATGVSYTIKLATQPSENVTLTVSGQSGTDLALAGLSATNTLTFTATTWNMAQTVTVTAGNDDDGFDDAATLTHTAAGGQYDGDTATLPVVVGDDDRAIVLTPSSLALDEGDTTGASYTVRLATQPAEDVKVTVSGQSGTDLTLTGLSATNTLTFTTSMWNIAQTVTLTAGQDTDDVDDSVTLTHTAAGGEYEGVSATFDVAVTDDERGIILTPESLTVDEGDTTGVSYTVKLATEPDENVTVTISGHAGTDVRLTGLSATNTLTFTSTTWDTAQTVTVTAGQDADDADDMVTLTLTATGAEYEGDTTTLPVTVTDDDRAIVLSEAYFEVTEGDTTGHSYTVNSPPSPMRTSP